LSRKYKIDNLPEVLLDYRNNSQSLHQVNKKREYDDAAFNQAVRNLRFYAGDEYSLSKECIKCLQFDTGPLVKQQDIGSIVKCFQQLDFITEKIVTTENINRDTRHIREAAMVKRRLTLSLIMNRLPGRKAVLLLLRLGEFGLLLKKLQYSLKGRMSYRFSAQH